MNRVLSRSLAAAALVAAGLVLTPGAAHAATAAITVHSEGDGGYTAELTIRNTETTPLTGWRVEFDLPAGTTIQSAWNTTTARSGGHWTFTPASWNATVPAGGSVSFGWVASGTGKPTGCLLGGA